MFAHLCCVDLIASHHIASLLCHCAVADASPLSSHHNSYLGECWRIFVKISLDITRHRNSNSSYLYTVLCELVCELVALERRGFEKFVKRITEMRHWKKCFTCTYVIFFREKNVNMFFNTDTLLNNCRSAYWIHKHCQRAYNAHKAHKKDRPVNSALICSKMKCSQPKAISFNDVESALSVSIVPNNGFAVLFQRHLYSDIAYNWWLTSNEKSVNEKNTNK